MTASVRRSTSTNAVGCRPGQVPPSPTGTASVVPSGEDEPSSMLTAPVGRMTFCSIPVWTFVRCIVRFGGQGLPVIDATRWPLAAITEAS